MSDDDDVRVVLTRSGRLKITNWQRSIELTLEEGAKVRDGLTEMLERVHNASQPIEQRVERIMEQRTGLSNSSVPLPRVDTLKDGVAKVVEQERQQRVSAVGMNGGQLCDTRSGPCSCGAWH